MGSLQTLGRPKDLQLLTRIRALITDDDDETCVATLREALKATTNQRAPRGEDGKVNHELMPDWGARLCSVRIMLAYKYGLPPKHHEVTIRSPGVDFPAATPQEHFAELIESGADIVNVLETWVGALKRAEPVLVGPVEAEKAAETTQTAKEVEVLEV